MSEKANFDFETIKERWVTLYRHVKQVVKTRAMEILNNIVWMNRVMQFCYLFGITGIGGWGIVIAIPYLYAEYDEQYSWYARGFGYIIAIELMVNWFCMRFVDTSYNPFLHGVMPNGVVIGQNVCRQRDKEERIQNGHNNSGRARKDASTIDMNNGSVMYVATELPKSEDSPPTRTAYPYFSWTPCLRCNRPRPPRCHHCPICDKCILKRDHHCFITGVCVGYHNLRHFIVFLTWAVIGTLFALIHALVYAYYDVFPHTSYADVIFPLAIARAAIGYIEWQFVLLIILGWICLAYFVWSLAFLEKLKVLVEEGRTSFELNFKMNVRDTRNRLGKIRAVFGDYWLVNFIVPLHSVFKPDDDPVIWPHIKA